MKKQPIPQIHYKFLFPTPGPKPPPTFHQFVNEVRDPEIRAEIAEWYNCHTSEELEKVYPDWDYTDRNVRIVKFYGEWVIAVVFTSVQK